MPRQLEQPSAEESFLRRINAGELDIAAEADAIKESRPEGCAASCFFASDALHDVKVVLDLRAVVAVFGLRGVVIADRGIHRHTVYDIAVRLEVGKEPVVIFVA